MKSGDTSWDPVASWYGEHLGKSGTYHETVVVPNLIRIVNPKSSEKIIDVACGQGIVSRALAKSGAKIVGVDLSSLLINEAKRQSSEISYEIRSADNLEGFPNASFDKACLVLALQNIENYQSAIGEVARVLKPNGLFTIVLNHPSFRIPKRSSWQFDDKEGIQYRRIDGYLSESQIEIVAHPGDPESSTTVSFHRPLQSYVKAMRKFGLVIVRLEEWTANPEKESEPGPRKFAEDRARKEFPLFLCIETKKL
jgi:SAM-dependent methyltransferase